MEVVASLSQGRTAAAQCGLFTHNQSRSYLNHLVHSLGLSKQYGKKDSEPSQFLKKILGLSLLPPADVSDCFALDLYPIFRTTSECNSFATTC